MWKPVIAAAKNSVGRPLVLVGAGNLGNALATYNDFGGYNIVAALDNDVTRCGKPFGLKKVEHISSIRKVIQDSGASVAIVAVPGYGKEAQEVTQKCVDAGICTILNYSPVTLDVPSHVYVEDMDLASRVERAVSMTPRSTGDRISPRPETNIGFSARMLGLSSPSHRVIESGLLLAPLLRIRRTVLTTGGSLRFMSTCGTPRFNDSSAGGVSMPGREYMDKLPPRYSVDFEELELLGTGGYGSVYAARNRIDDSEYAVKKVNMSIDPTTFRDLGAHKYLREARAMAKLNHVNIVRYFHSWIEIQLPDCPVDPLAGVIDLAVAESKETISENSFSPIGSIGTSGKSGNDSILPSPRVMLFICMEYCPGRTLREYISRLPFAPSQSNAHKIVRQMLQGLRHIHEHGLIHRDITPSNIFILDDLQIKIGDFGLSCRDRQIKSDIIPAMRVPGQTSGVGTHLYASPEQLTQDRYDSRTDVYSVGLILLELLQPFKTQMERVTVLSNAKDGFMPAALTLRYPRESALIQKMLNQDPLQRPFAVDALKELKGFLSEGKSSF